MTKKVNGKERIIEEEIFDNDKSSDRISRLVNKIWLCRYPRCRYLIYNNGSEFKLHFETLCDSYGIKPNPQANAICERIHQVLGTMMRTTKYGDKVVAPLNVTPPDFLVLLKEAVRMTIIPSPTVDHSMTELLDKINGMSPRGAGGR
jgi:hypothetical protein